MRVASAARGCALVITDYPTRTGDGATVTQLLRRDPRTQHIKILNATTHAFWDELDEANAAGVDATLILPAVPGQLVACVRRLLADGQRRRP
jgi:CheY-like chemotaxis protein